MPSNLPTPDIIDDGRLRQGKKLSPAAQPVGAYRAPTRDDVAEPPQDNSYSQLGRALSSMSGTMNQATAYTKQIQDQQDLAASKELDEELQKKNVTAFTTPTPIASGASDHS